MSLRRCDSSARVRTGASRRAILLAAVLILSGPLAAYAQTSRFALDAVAAADVDHGSQVTRHSTAWFDVFGAVRIAGGLDLRARPVVFRRSFDGTWQGQIYELAMRYERPGPIGLRVDAGQFSSPIGLSILENRPDIFHLHSWTRGAGLNHLAQIAQLGIPCIVTMHVPSALCMRGTMLLHGRQACDGRIDEKRCAQCWSEFRGVPSSLAYAMAHLPRMSFEILAPTNKIVSKDGLGRISNIASSCDGRHAASGIRRRNDGRTEEKARTVPGEKMRGN